VSARRSREGADVRIRAPRSGDHPALSDLRDQLQGVLRRRGRDDGCRELLAERAGRGIVAYGVVEDVGAPMARLAVAVAAERPVRGVAGLLVERLAAAAWAEGSRRVVIHAPLRGADLAALLRRRCARGR
jgi:hypothetical protein